MSQALLCSECFRDQGLKFDAYRIGFEGDTPCPQCGRRNGRKLDKDLVIALAHRFFVRGTVHRTEYGAAPVVKFNEHHYGRTEIKVSEWLKRDVELIGEAARIGFFHYGPRLWMVGEVVPLKALQMETERDAIIGRILIDYPKQNLTPTETFFRLRKNPQDPACPSQYDSPPVGVGGKGRVDGDAFPVLYGSQDLEVCLHECRVSVEDELYLSTLRPTRPLKCLDLTALVHEDVTEFESIDIAVHMLFLAGEHSYPICRAVAAAAQNSGFDGVIYPSYFSLVRTGAQPFDTAYGISIRRFKSLRDYARSQVIPNLALFGRPVELGTVCVECINRVVLSRVGYDVRFGPVEY
jgi:hypothetical protein